jgi:hypothetical protein
MLQWVPVMVVFLHSRSSLLCLVLCVCGRRFVVFCAMCFSELYTCIRVLFGSNLGRGTGYTDSNFFVDLLSPSKKIPGS